HRYLGEKVAAWDQDLKPRPNHVDDRITVSTPLKKPGVYLLRGQMAGGNLSRIIVWVSDTAIVRKNLEGKAFYFVADAVTGQPVPKIKVDFFGWQMVPVAPNRNEWRVDTIAFSDTTDADGRLVLDQARMPMNYQWLVTAHSDQGGAGGAGRFAYLGFGG